MLTQERARGRAEGQSKHAGDEAEAARKVDENVRPTAMIKDRRNNYRHKRNANGCYSCASGHRADALMIRARLTSRLQVHVYLTGNGNSLA